MKHLFGLLFFCFFIIPLSAFEDLTVDTEALSRLWYGETEGKPVGQYYQLEFNGKILHGKREWKVRWDLLSTGVNWTRKRVLELGSNTGICSLFLSKYMPVEKVVAIDKLPKAVLYMQRLQDIFHTKFSVYQLDLDEDPYESILGYDYDIVLCMSLYRWVHNKERLLRYLSRFSEILYEGHHSAEEEIARFESIGFHKHVFLGMTDARRALILFSK